MPVPLLAGDAIRLVPLDERYIPDFEQLIDDPDVVRNTCVPSGRPSGCAATWIDRDTAR